MRMSVGKLDAGRKDISLGRIADILFCTTKHAKRVLKRYEQMSLLNYIPGKGRGHTSALYFCNSIEMDIDHYMEGLLEEGKMEEAMMMAKSALFSQGREIIHNKLEAYLGFHTKEDSALDILRIPVRRNLSSLDPVRVSVTTESHISRQIFDTLVLFNEYTSRIEPHLAHSWEYHPDLMKWTFYLRKGIYFHDGKQMTSQDVIYTFKRLATKESVNKWLLEDIDDIYAHDGYTIIFQLKRKNVLFINYLAQINACILPSHYQSNSFAIVGSGPYKVAKYTENQLILEANHHYFKERAWLDRIEILFLPQATDISLHYEVVNDQKSEPLMMKEVSLEQVGCRYIMFNFKKPKSLIGKDFYLRKALFELLDQQAMAKELGGLRDTPSSSFFPEKSKRRIVAKSLERAASFLRKSGYRGETLTLYYLNKEESKGDAIWFQKRCEQAGILFTIYPFDILDYSLSELENEADLLMMGEVFNQDFEISFLSVFKNEVCFINRFMADKQLSIIYKNLERMLESDSREKRYLYMDTIEDYLNDECLMLFNYHPFYVKQHSESLEGLEINAFGWPDFRSIWVKPNDMQSEGKVISTG